MIPSRYISKLIVISILAFLGWYTYAYFCDRTTPCVMVSGITENVYHCGEVQCGVQADKNGFISLWLDNQALANNFKIKAQHDGHVFSIPTKTLSNGKHTLKIEFTDNRLIVGLCEVVETEADNNRKNDEIISVIRNGYIRGKELIRPAQIIVVKN